MRRGREGGGGGVEGRYYRGWRGKRSMGLLLSSGSARKRIRKSSVFLVALPVHISHTLSLSGSATNSYSAFSMMLFGHTSGGWALGSFEASAS